jgi:hypothetical protein
VNELRVHFESIVAVSKYVWRTEDRTPGREKVIGLTPKVDGNIGKRASRCLETARTTVEQTITMKEKSTKQSKQDKPAVELKDLQPTKDSKGQRRATREMPGGMGPGPRRLGPLA